MDIIKLLNELDRMIDEQKTVMSMTWNFHAEDYLDITNKIRASLPEDVKKASRVTAESDKIVDGARVTAEQTLEDATVEADEIIREARINAERHLRETEAETNKMNLTAEAQAAKTVEEARVRAEKMLAEAHAHSEKKVTDAVQQAEAMLSQSELVRLATAQAREIVAAAEQDSSSLRLGADQYAHGVMTDLEKQVGELIATIQRGRMKLDGRVGPAAGHNGTTNGSGRGPELAAPRR